MTKKVRRRNRSSRKVKPAETSSRTPGSEDLIGPSVVRSAGSERAIIDSFNMNHILGGWVSPDQEIRRLIAIHAVRIATMEKDDDFERYQRWRLANTEFEFRLTGFGGEVQAHHNEELKQMEFRGGNRPEMALLPWGLTIWHGKRLLLCVEWDEHENFEILELLPGEWQGLLMRINPCC